MPDLLPPEVLARIAEAIRSIRYGTVQITIHDSRVVQIEKAEKIRVAHADPIAGGQPFTGSRTDRTSGSAPNVEQGT